MDVLVVNYRLVGGLAACLRSVLEFAPTAKIYVWDNASEFSEDVAKSVGGLFPNVTWRFSDANTGFARAVNELMMISRSPFTLLLNPDARVTADLEPLAAALRRDAQVCASAPMTTGAFARPWDVARRTPTWLRSAIGHAGLAQPLRGTPLSDYYLRPPRNPGYLSGACIMIRRSTWDRIGPFDERFFLYSEEVDWCVRARASGWRLALVPEVLVHHEAMGTVSSSPVLAARSAELLIESHCAFLSKHYGQRAVKRYFRAASAARRIRDWHAPRTPVTRPTVDVAVAGAEASTSATALPLVVYHLAPSRSAVGGMATVIAEYESWPWPRSVHRRIVTYNGRSHARSARLAVGAALQLIWIRIRRDDAVIHAHISQRGSVLREGGLLLLASLMGLPVSASIHGSSFAEFATRHHWLVRAALGRAAFCTSLSAEARAALLAAGVAPGRVLGVPNAVQQSSVPLPAVPLPPRVVFGGEVGRRKGVDVLLAAWREVVAVVPTAELHIAGPEGDIALPTEPSVVAHGPLTRELLADLISQSTVGVLPSRAEGMPMFVLECMARGRAVVASAVGGIPEVVASGHNGSLIRPDDAGELAAALLVYLQSRQLAVEHGNAASETVSRRFGADAVMRTLEDAWQGARDHARQSKKRLTLWPPARVPAQEAPAFDPDGHDRCRKGGTGGL